MPALDRAAGAPVAVTPLKHFTLARDNLHEALAQRLLALVVKGSDLAAHQAPTPGVRPCPLRGSRAHLEAGDGA